MDDIYTQINNLASKYALELHDKINSRIVEMKHDDKSHYLIYHVLGIADDEGDLIDTYQNKGRLLYNNAGSFLEEATILCFMSKFADCKKKVKIPNTFGTRPKTFEIDCLVSARAHEIKWRDATTDGDHITKENTRIQAIRAAGYTPIRVMFYYPQREQSVRVQNTLKTLYAGVNGEFYFGDAAWEYIKNETGIDLFHILNQIAQNNQRE